MITIITLITYWHLLIYGLISIVVIKITENNAIAIILLLISNRENYSNIIRWLYASVFYLAKHRDITIAIQGIII